MQTKQKAFKFTEMQFYTFFCRRNLENYDISHAFLLLTITKLLTLKYSSFLAHAV